MSSLSFIIVPSLIIYFSTLTNTIYGGDAGDLVSAILTKGFAHPPGYALYTLLGRLSVNIPVSLLTFAGKVTVISLLSTICSLLLLFKIIELLNHRFFDKKIALLTVWILMSNYLIWLYAIVPEVFPLNTFIILLILYTALKFRKTLKIIWLYFLLFFIGLGIVHHHTFIFIIPTVFILIRKKIKSVNLSKRNIIFIFLFFIIGLLPLIYLPIVSLSNPEIIWGKAQTLSGFMSLITREAYGSFVPGPFISNSANHRFIQLINLNNFLLGDFTMVGYIPIIIGLFIFVKSKIIDHTEKIAVLFSLFLFGPFFFFYANFPLRDKFELATVERFLLIFYFLLGIPYYFGLEWMSRKLTQLFMIFLKSKKLSSLVVFIVLITIPLSFTIKNYLRLIPLRKTQIAENMGKDILNNAFQNSIILLSGDSILFNTQYIYYSNKDKYKNKIIIQSTKIGADYYIDSLKYNYPKLKFSKKKNYDIGHFIEDNALNSLIYSTDKYSLPVSSPYKWIVQGLLFKLVPKDYNNEIETDNNIKNFWENPENKNLTDYFLKNKTHWLNYFPNDIPRIYSTAYQNSAFYYLDLNKTDVALPYISKAAILNPDDIDVYFLESLYFVKNGNCQKAEESIMKAINKSKDNLYLSHLKQIGKCYKDEFNIQRIKNLVKKYSDQPLKELIN